MLDLSKNGLKEIISQTLKRQHLSFCQDLFIARISCEELGYDEDLVLETLNETLFELWEKHNEVVSRDEKEIREMVREKVELFDIVFGK